MDGPQRVSLPMIASGDHIEANLIDHVAGDSPLVPRRETRAPGRTATLRTLSELFLVCMVEPEL